MNTIEKIRIYSIYLLSLFIVIGCNKKIEDPLVDIQERILSFEVSNSLPNAPGKDYPLVPELEPGSGVHTFSVHLMGASFDAGKTFNYRVVEGETTAEEGVHFRLVDEGEYTIPGRQKEANIRVQILDFTSEMEGSVVLVLELLDGEEAIVDESKKRIGIPILLQEKPDPIVGTPLLDVLRDGSRFNSIYIDPSNPNLPLAFRQAFVEAAANVYNAHAIPDIMRWRLKPFIIHLLSNNEVLFVFPYIHANSSSAPGNTVTNAPVNLNHREFLKLVYKFEPDGDGVGSLVRDRVIRPAAHMWTDNRVVGIKPILDYIEGMELKFDWVDQGIAMPPRSGVLLGGLIGVGADADHYVFGTTESLSSTVLAQNGVGNFVWPIPSAPIVHESFYDSNSDDYFNALLIDPKASYHSDAFGDLWNQVEAEATGLTLHKSMFHFIMSGGVSTWNFNEARFVTFYRQGVEQRREIIRFDFNVEHDDTVRPFFELVRVNMPGTPPANSVVSALAERLKQNSFTMTKAGSRVRFTDKSDANFYFEGELTKVVDAEVHKDGGYWPD